MDRAGNTRRGIARSLRASISAVRANAACRLSTAALVLAAGALASSVSRAQTPIQSPTVSVRPGAWTNTQILLQAGDNFVVQTGGQLSCAQCNGSPTATPRGIGDLYHLFAQVGSTQYDLTQSPTVTVREGGALYLIVGSIQADQAQYWQGSYQVRVTYYPKAAGGTTPTPTPTPTPTNPQFPFVAWGGGDCRRLETEGVSPSPQLALPGGMSKICEIYMEDWVPNGDPMWVCLPGATPGDNWVGHPSGIVVFGSGFRNTWDLTGFSSGFQEAQPRHAGHSVFQWNLHFSARPNATGARIAVEAYQGRACGQPTGNVVRFDIPVAVQQIPTFQVSLPAVFWTGYQLAVAAHSAYANWAPATTRQYLINAQQQAAGTGLLDTQSTTGFVIAQLDRGQTSAAVSGLITQVNDRFREGLNRNCTCDGVSTNIVNVYAAAYNLCLAEIATLNNLPAASLQSYLNLAKQQAQTSQLLPTQGIDQALVYVGQGRQSAELKDYMAALRNQLTPYVQRNCTCR